MNWEAIGAIGEIVGALAVVISLIYLATQIRTQNTESRLASIHEILVGFRESLQVFASGDAAEIMARANEDYDSLSNAETVKLICGIYPILRVWEEAFIQYENGRLEERVWVGINSQYASYLGYPSVARVWDLRKSHFDQSFQDMVQKLERTEVKIR